MVTRSCKRPTARAFAGPGCDRSEDCHVLKRLFAATTLGVIGLALMIVSYVYALTFAGLPYQEPAPERQAAWEMHTSVSNRRFVLGGLVLLVAVALLLLAVAVRLLDALRRKSS